MTFSKFVSGFFLILILTACGGQTEKKYQPVSVVNHPLWSINKVVYRVNLKQFGPKNNFLNLQQKINQLKDFGAGIILITAVHVTDTIDNTIVVKDHLGLNPAFGTPEEFKGLVKAIHSAGMFIIMDWHGFKMSVNNAVIHEHPDFFEKSGQPGNSSEENPVLKNTDYGNPDLQKYMLDALKYWVFDFDIDGYFCLHSENIPIQFWDKTRRELELIKPVFMAADGEASFLHNRAFDMTVSRHFFETIKNVVQGRANINTLDQILEKEQREYTPAAFRMRFTSFPDIGLTWESEDLKPDIRKPAAVLAMTFPGKPFLNYPNEKMSSSLENIYKKLNHLYQNNPALYLGKMVKLSSALEPSIYAFARLKEQYKIIVLLNFSDKQAKITLDSNVLTGKYTELFSNVSLTFGNSREFDLEPLAYRVFVGKIEN